MTATLTANEAIQKLEETAHRAGAEEKATRRISAAKTRLLIGKDAKSVFFGMLVTRLDFEVLWDIETAATDGRRIVYNPDFVNTITEQELIGILAHEVLHCANKHFARQAGRDLEKWNIAADLAINPLLIESGFKLPASLLMPGEDDYTDLKPGLSAEEYYAEITKKPEDEPQGEQQEDGAPSDDQDEDSPADDTGDQPGEDDNGKNDDSGTDDEQSNQTNQSNQAPDPGACGGIIPPQANGQPASPAELNQLDREWSANIANAQQAAESRGNLPGGIQRVCDKALQPAADWKQALRDYILKPAKKDYNWKRPNRRHVHRGLFLPSTNSLEIGHIIAAVDTSGSITAETLARFAGELDDISRQGASRITILYHDSDIVNVDEWTPEDGPLTLSPCGGGGTDHRPVFDWIETNLDEPPAVLVCLTDLWSEFPETAPDYPVMWASTCERATHPFGERIDIPAE